MSDIVLKHGDIYAQIAQIPDKSGGLIIIDPPYDIPNNNIFHSKLLKDRPFEFGLAHSSVNNWGVSNPFPPYLECVFKWAKKAKKYDELIKDLQS